MSMRRRTFVLFGAAALAIPHVTEAQPKVARVGFLLPLAADDPENKSRMASLWRGLRELGWTEGRNIRVEYRYAAGDAAKMRQHAAGNAVRRRLAGPAHAHRSVETLGVRVAVDLEARGTRRKRPVLEMRPKPPPEPRA